MINLKTPVITTDRLMLRAPRAEDFAQFQAAKEEVWSELQNWMSWASDDQKEVGKTHEFFANSGLREDGSAVLLGANPINNDFIVASGFDCLGNNEYATGYWVSKKYLGQGYATEATNAILRYLFNALNAKAVHINYYDGNKNSKRVIEKLGFEFNETKAKFHTQFSTGKQLDSHHYIRTNADHLPALKVEWVTGVETRPFFKREWMDFKAKRLQALAEVPNVFLTKYEDAAARPDEWWQFGIEDPNRQILGVFDADKLIGITAVYVSEHDPSGKTAMLGMSFIDAEYRGKGHSSKLYQARIDWARKAGFEKVAVGHRKGNDASKAANQKFGFTFVEEEEIDFPDGRGIDCRYELRLKP